MLIIIIYIYIYYYNYIIFLLIIIILIFFFKSSCSPFGSLPSPPVWQCTTSRPLKNTLTERGTLWWGIGPGVMLRLFSGLWWWLRLRLDHSSESGHSDRCDIFRWASQHVSHLKREKRAEETDNVRIQKLRSMNRLI